jgi:hypothetical protein
MIALDERQDRQDRVDLMSSAGTFFQQVQHMVEQYPPLAIFGMELLQFVLKSYKGGKEIEPLFSKAFITLSQLAEQKMQQAQVTPPTPGVLEAQARLQIAQIQSQDTHQKNMVTIEEVYQRMAIERERLQLDHDAKMKELELKAQEVAAKFTEIEARTNIDAASLSIKRQLDELNIFIKEQKLEIDKQKVELQGYESLLEETRLGNLESKNAFPTTKTGKIITLPDGRKQIEIREHPIIDGSPDWTKLQSVHHGVMSRLPDGSKEVQVFKGKVNNNGINV